MITLRFDANGLVTMVSRIDTPKAGDLSVEALPPEPEARPPYAPVLYVRDRVPVWEMVEVCEPEAERAAEPEEPAPTHAEIEAARAAAYRATVDPITCEIQRLRDMGGSAAEIAEAEARREAEVAAIKAQWPYQEGAE